MAIEPEFYEFASHEIARRGDRALGFAREQRDAWHQGQSAEDQARQLAFWDKVIAAIEDLERATPSPAVPPCLLCGFVAEKTTRLPDGGIEQYCADCGLFRVAHPLAGAWEAEPKAWRLEPEVEAYLDRCAERGEMPVLSDFTLHRLKRSR